VGVSSTKAVELALPSRLEGEMEHLQWVVAVLEGLPGNGLSLHSRALGLPR
jgi:hypothetical protein